MLNPKRALWLDFESASDVSLQTSGAVRYAADPSTQAIVLAYAIDDQAAKSWHMHGQILDWRQAPQDLRDAFNSDRALVAWNMSFDREIWNFATIGFPHLEPRRTYDAAVQGTASGLPADLENASRRLGGAGKDKRGGELIKKFCVRRESPLEFPDDWKDFLAYARRDIDTMREVLELTLPLSAETWATYHAFEIVNARGIEIDVAYVRNAAELAAVDRIYTGRRLSELTSRQVTGPTKVPAMRRFLYELLPAEARAIMEAPPDPDDEEEDDEDEAPTTGKLTLRKRVITALRIWLELHRHEFAAANILLEILDIREFSGGTSQSKFARMMAQHVDGTIAGQYQFGGAPQTGRMSSRGIQIHNLTRDAVGTRAQEAELIESIAEGAGYQAIAECEPRSLPVAKKLALMVRPALVAAPGRTFTWSDWSAIEARITPWLAASPSAEEVLDVFRANDADPSLPDIYRVAAGGIWGKDPLEVEKEGPERQTGKVATLALGFGGGKRALQAMAVGYKVFLDDDEAKRIVDAWRLANPWAPAFWSALWQAALSAWASPGTITKAGRIGFRFFPRLIDAGGSLVMMLPSGRPLIYPSLKWRSIELKDEYGQIYDTKQELTFMRSYGRAKIWHGTLCENAVQATAADILRGTVRRLVEDTRLDRVMPIRGHTHDEVLVEHDPGFDAAPVLHDIMVQGFDWSEGLPLAADEKTSWWYSKAKGK